jgi:hypothetical protein
VVLRVAEKIYLVCYDNGVDRFDVLEAFRSRRSAQAYIDQLINLERGTVDEFHIVEVNLYP